MSGKCNTWNNVYGKVRQALKHAANLGIVKQRAGKFKINTDLLNTLSNSSKYNMEGRRRRKRQKTQRRRRHRHQKHTTPNIISLPSESSNSQKNERENGIDFHRHSCDNPESFAN